MDLRRWELQMLRRLLRLRRRATESFMDFNRRTAFCIRSWQHQYRVPSLAFCVLKAVFKAAWRQHFVQPNGDGFPLRFANDFRSAVWWETVQCLSTPHKRRKTGFQHFNRGQQTFSWEHPFVEAWGGHWTIRRDACPTADEWLKSFTTFVEVFSCKWELPWMTNDVDKSSYGREEMWTSVRVPASIDDPPAPKANPRELRWSHGGKRLWIQADNQLVAHAYSGVATVAARHLQPICIRIGRKLESLLFGGWRPRLDEEAFIEWDPRELNSVADHAANAAFDFGADWDRIGIENTILTTSRWWRVTMDGASRGDGTAAAGIAIYCYEGPAKAQVVDRAGRVLDGVTSSLVAELIALELVLEFFTKVLEICIS